jgi:hypothetical protein
MEWQELRAIVPAMKLCTIQVAVGEVEACPEGACPFWEEGGAALDAACELERLGLDLERSDLSGYLLEIRRTLEAARGREEQAEARRAFAELVPPDISGR